MHCQGFLGVKSPHRYNSQTYLYICSLTDTAQCSIWFFFFLLHWTQSPFFHSIYLALSSVPLFTHPLSLSPLSFLILVPSSPYIPSALGVAPFCFSLIMPLHENTWWHVKIRWTLWPLFSLSPLSPHLCSPPLPMAALSISTSISTSPVPLSPPLLPSTLCHSVSHFAGYAVALNKKKNSLPFPLNPTIALYKQTNCN